MAKLDVSKSKAKASKRVSREGSAKTKATKTTCSSRKIVSIEACKQWGAFKSRANKIQKAVEKIAFVKINTEKPSKGNFVVHVSGLKKPIVELVGMKRPFPDLKALDMDEVVKNIVSALEGTLDESVGDSDSKTHDPEVDNVTKAEKVVVIEACKQWNAFKSRALKIQRAIGNKATVEINKDKPGKGNFVVRINGLEEPIVELLGMKRPFSALKALDIDDVAEKVNIALS